MEPVGVQLAPVMSDTLYELPAHSASYPYTSSFWGPREERLYPSPSNQNVNTVIRHTEPLRTNHTEQKALSTDVIPEEDHDVTDWNCDTERKEEDNNQSEQGTQKQSQVACTLKWLTENYERAEGVCLPRCVLYTHYLDFCKKMKYTPAGAATFGKIIRQKFPKLTTRRLGTRGQSKYHYYGIGIKESSIYYHSVYSGKGLTRFSGIKIKTEGSNRKYSLSSKTGTLLPEFPNADNLILPENIDREKMRTFIMMYRTHCQRILDTIISANFDEVQNFLLHFWQGMPEHLLELLNIEMVADIVALCDSILYKVLIDVLIPSTIQDLPESLGSEINVFLKKLPYWLHSSLEDVCDALSNRKIQVMKTFIQSIRRQISFVHLAQITRSVLLNHETLNQMIEDVADVDFTEICCQASFTETKKNSEFKRTIAEMYEEFQNLLSKQAPVEGYTEWLDNIIDKCVLQPTKDKSKSFKDKASEFLLQWEMFGSFFMRDLTLHSAASFGSFHLIRMTFDEYVFLVMETQQDQLKELNLQKNVQKYMKNAEEIKMHAKVRTPSAKHQQSPKSKKRKHSEDQYDSSADEAEGCFRASDENRPSMTDSYSSLNGTAFSRPLPSSNRDPCGHAFSDDSCRANISHSTLPLSPLKHYPSLNSSSYDRPTYLPQYGLNGLNSYSDLMSASNSLSAPRVQNYGDSHLQSFSTVPFSNSVAQTAGTYWTDNRTHPPFPDPYNPYSYNKFHSSYDTYNKSTILRSGSYQDAFNRSAFDASRTYYRGAHDNFQVGSHLSMGGFNSNYMDIAQPATQYGRQDPVFYQDDLYSSPMASSFSSLGKPYLAATFR